MKFLSFTYLFAKAKSSLLRFPWVLFCAVMGVFTALVLVAYDNKIANKLPYINTMLTFTLGVPLFFCFAIFKENIKIGSKKIEWLLQGVGILFLGFIYWSLPAIEDTHNTSVPYVRYGLFNLIIHLLVSFVPYLKTKELNGFWNYNKILFLRLCTSVLYTGFIYIGLALALFAVDNLFHVVIDSKVYVYVYIVAIGLFNTWFFVSGIPDRLQKLDTIKTYPNGLKLFTQYVLLPLTLLYFVILYAYGAKIIMNWNWPKGWVSYLVLGVSILGFFTILLIYPYSKLKGNDWIKKFSNIFFYALIPLLVLLFIAIAMRVNSYGVTVKRYSVLLLSVWIGLVCVYFIFKKDNIKFIPVSLAILLLMVSFGPWGMFSVSERSQIHRLRTLLTEHQLLFNGRIKNEVIWVSDSLPKFESGKMKINPVVFNDTVHNQIKSILDYLDDYHGLKKIRPWFRQDLDKMITTKKIDGRSSYQNEARIYMRTMGLTYQKKHSWNRNKERGVYRANSVLLIPVEGYDYYYPFYFHKNNVINFKTVKRNISFERQDNVLYITNAKDTLRLDVGNLHAKLEAVYGKKTQNKISRDKLSLKMSSHTLNAKIELETINFFYQKDSLVITDINGKLFFKQK